MKPTIRLPFRLTPHALLPTLSLFSLVPLLLAPSALLAQGWSDPENLGSGVNSNDFEIDPCLAENDTALYFASMYENTPNDYDLRVSYYRNGAWQPSSKLGDSINRPIDREVRPYVTPDGHWLFFDRIDGPGYRSLFSEKLNGVWQSPRRLRDLGLSLDDSTGLDGGVRFNRDMTRCYFTSYRRGVSNPDIWMCEKVGGVWQPPTILSDSINTPEVEWKPSVTADESELYFVTDRGPSYRYFAYSKKKNGVWQGRVDMDYPVSDPDKSAVAGWITGDGMHFYFSTWPFGINDIDIWVSHRIVGVEEAEKRGSQETNILRYRNPSGFPLVIEYSLPKSGSFRLGVYDLQGRLVGVVLEGKGGPGRQKAIWRGLGLDGRQVSNGVYFLVLETEGKASARKVVLLR